jgi:hypothetical protein
MFEFKTDLLLWISSIADHWGSLVTGGALVGLLALLKEHIPHYLKWATALRIGVAFLLFAIFQSWEQEYKSRIGREKDLVSSNHTIDLMKQDFRFESQRLTSICDTRDAVNQTLQNQNRSQQGTINGCLSQAIRLIAPPTPHIKSFPTTNAQRPGVPQIDYILTTNIQRSPVDLIAQCNFPIVDAEFTVLTESGGTTQIELGRSVGTMQYQMTISSPAWTASDPLKITLFLGGSVDRLPRCSFAPH